MKGIQKILGETMALKFINLLKTINSWVQNFKQNESKKLMPN